MKRHLAQGQLINNVPLKHLNSWHIGGAAEQLYRPSSIDDLSHFLKNRDGNSPLTWLGLGSNVLIRDSGIKGAVIATQGGLNKLFTTGNQTIRAEAGVSCPQVARFAARNNLSGAEFLAGIPGTIGGALKMNAGAFGGETWSFVEQVETIDNQGITRVRPPCDYDIQYRKIKGHEDEWFVAAHFKFTGCKQTSSLDKIKQLLRNRSNTQPTGQPSCGCVFKNPNPHYAAQLIENANLKGIKVGDAEVSQKHANFIINHGAATSSQIEMLIEKVQRVIFELYGIQLVPEVCIIGDK